MSEVVLLDLILTNKEEPVMNMKFKGNLGYSYNKKEELKILRGKNKAKSRIRTLDFSHSYFVLFRHLLGKIPRKMTPEGRGVQVSWLIFKDHHHQAQSFGHRDQQEITQRQQETCMDEQGASDKTQI